jgi:putative oxidoreductase
MKPFAWIQSVMFGTRSWEQFAILLSRVSVGTFFAISGGNKLFVASRTRRMYETLAGAGIPFPHFMTYFVPRSSSSAAACLSSGCFRVCAALLLSSR